MMQSALREGAGAQGSQVNVAELKRSGNRGRWSRLGDASLQTRGQTSTPHVPLVQGGRPPCCRDSSSAPFMRFVTEALGLRY